jgi:hypothetical protein
MMGEGEWKVKHGADYRRQWRKHLGMVPAKSGQWK